MKPLSRLIVTRRDDSRIVKIRRTLIGGTDIAPILGLSEKRTRFAVWASKVADVVDADPTLAEESEAGSFLEPLILKRFAERLGVDVDSRPRTYRLRAKPFLGANPDGLVTARGSKAGPRGLVDAKSRSPFVRNRWGAPGSGDIPPDELCQVLWYLHILDFAIAYVAVFFDRVLTIFVVHRDREMGVLMEEEATAFWNQFVATKREPPFEGAAAAAYLRHKYPRALTPPREATPDELAMAERRELLKRLIDEKYDQLSAVEGALKDRIGECSGLYGTGVEVFWSNRKGPTNTDWAAVVAELRSFPLLGLDEGANELLRAQIEDATRRFTKTSADTRSFKIVFKGPRPLLSEPSPITVEIAPQQPALPPAEE